jgi:hypothetical protein
MHQIHRTVANIIAAMLAVCLLGLAGCSPASPPPTSSPVAPTLLPSPSVTPTHEMPQVQCTAPWCWEDADLHCPGTCPGGCGTTCATRTPDPRASPTPTIPPPADICTFPTPAADPSVPHIDLCASALKVHPGDKFQLVADLTPPNWVDYVAITLQDVDGPGNIAIMARLGDHLPVWHTQSAYVDLEIVQTHNHQIYLLLSAKSPGAVKIDFLVVPTSPDIRASITITVE